jgi:hypothetical protein
MTSSNLGFIAKVVLASGAIGAVIKYLIPQLALAPSLGLSLGLLLGPSALMAVLLWRLQRSTPDQSL